MVTRVEITAQGAPEVMRLVEAVLPPPQAGEVQIEHKAIGLNFLDTYFRSGLYPVAGFPFTPGNEGAGLVTHVGAGVEGVKPGDRVAYVGAPGAYASARNLAAASVVPLPAEISFELAASVMLKGLTAEYLLFRTFALQKGQIALVHAAAGGTGLLLVQWAKALGAKVIGTVGSQEKAVQARAAGCDEVILYRSEDVPVRVREITDGAMAHVVYDGVGKDTFLPSLDCLRPFGMLVSFGNASGAIAPFDPALLSRKGSLYLTRPTLFSHIGNVAQYRDMAARLFAALAAGVLKAEPQRRFALADVVGAHKALESRETIGASVLVPEEGKMREIVSLKGITKRFGALVANDSIDLQLNAGEIHALLGENGAGKSTLVKMMYGLLAPDSGEIWIEGKLVTLPSPRAARAAGIGMVFQHFSLFEEFTALENVAIPLEGQIANAELREKVRAKAEYFGLGIDLDRPVHTLSAGERQRIEILRALMQEPKLLILDEPTSVLTPAESESLFATLDLLAAEGASLLFISHKLEEVRRLCTRATILRHGKLVGTADPKTTSARELAAKMVGEGVADITPPQNRNFGGAVLKLEGLFVAPDTIHGVALNGVNLTVRSGEIVAIAGVAGNGQSELYAAISGEGGRVTAGQIEIVGRDVTRADINTRRKQGATFVPEQRLGQATLPQTALSDNIVLSWHATEGIGTLFVDRNRLVSVGSDIIKRFDVRTPGVEARAAQLSGGNLQKYIVGREVLRNPKLIIIDQPTWGVDARAAAHIRQTLIDLAAKGAAVLVITQDLDEAMEISHDIVVMCEGELSAPQRNGTITREEIGLLMTNHTKGHGHFVPKAGHGAASVPVSASTTPEFRQ